MKTNRLISISFLSACFLISPLQAEIPSATANSVPPGEEHPHESIRQMVLDRYDANHDGRLDDNEKAEIKKTWEVRRGKWKKHFFKDDKDNNEQKE